MSFDIDYYNRFRTCMLIFYRHMYVSSNDVTSGRGAHFRADLPYTDTSPLLFEGMKLRTPSVVPNADQHRLFFGNEFRIQHHDEHISGP